MEKSFNSFEKISRDFELSCFLKNADSYLSHTRKNKAPEKLGEHIKLVIDYFLIAVEKNNIESIIDKLIKELVLNYENKTNIGNFVKKLFLYVMIYHDLGKINENFQIQRMQNILFQNTDNCIGTTHSLLSSYIYIAHHFDEINKLNFKPNENCFLYGITLLLSYSIYKHHNSHLNNPFCDICFDDNIIINITNYLTSFQLVIDNFFQKEVFKKIIPIFNNFKEINFNNEFVIFAFLKINYSILTASDYYATTHYMNSFKKIYNDFGIFDSELKNKITRTIKKSTSYNEILFKNYNYFKKYPLENLQNKSNDNLNIIRQKISVEVIDNIGKNCNNNLFYIEAPTGSGKTNLSMLAISTLLENNKNYTKIFYVFPFTTLITQTYKSLVNSFGLNNEEITEIHSKVGINFENGENNDGLYGNATINYIDNLFINYPICLMSHIKLFDILKTNEKENNYLLHRLCNSIIIIDELQSYTPKHWDKIIYFIDNYAKYFNIKFILMSATLPKLDNLTSRVSNEAIIDLIPDAKRKYFLNPNFKDRVKYDYSLLEDNNLTLENFSDIVYEKSNCYEKKYGHVKTVVEFIFKKSASEFYKMLKDNEKYECYEILLLSGTILEPRRREIINFLKNEKNKCKRIILISTQVIEAGVDIDMDIGFKNKSILDSEEQLAGRINRNTLKEESVLYLFEYDESNRIYGNDLRYKMTREEINLDKYKDILENKKFDELYELVKNRINQTNQIDMIVNFSDYMEKLKNLEFYDIDKKFMLINEKTESIFVPLSIPIMILGADGGFENVFSKRELEFLKFYKVIGNNDNKVDGTKIWKLYENVTNYKKESFLLKKINFKILQGIMSNFIFSIFSYSSFLTELRKTCYYEEKYGYIYLKEFKGVYDYKDGIKDFKNNYSVFH